MTSPYVIVADKMAASSRGGVQRVLAKLQRSVDNGQYYEAHQMYRTLHFRYVSQKKYNDAIDLLYQGAVTLLEHKQIESGADLAILLVDILTKSQTLVSDDLIDKISYMNSMLKADTPERLKFIALTLKWSEDHSADICSGGHPDLHQKYALTFWHEKRYNSARYHFIRSRDGEGCASMLIEYQITKGYPSEVDIFIAQVVFQYLCLSNKSTAQQAFWEYTKQHPQVEHGPPFVRPLLNFLWFLFLAIEGGKLAVFTILVEQYQPALKRDPCYNDYLDRIGQLFFGVPPPRNSQQGLIGDLLSSFFGEDGSSLENQSSVSRFNADNSSIVELGTVDNEDLD